MRGHQAISFFPRGGEGRSEYTAVEKRTGKRSRRWEKGEREGRVDLSAITFERGRTEFVRRGTERAVAVCRETFLPVRYSRKEKAERYQTSIHWKRERGKNPTGYLSSPSGGGCYFTRTGYGRGGENGGASLFFLFVLFLFSTHPFPPCCPIEGPRDRKDEEKVRKEKRGVRKGPMDPKGGRRSNNLCNLLFSRASSEIPLPLPQ